MNAPSALSKLRFDWKKQANQTRTLSRSGKQMAGHICDFCVNKNTGQFYHGNETLADALGVSERSVQRHLTELVRLGWLRRVRVRGKRRVFQLAFPGGSSVREHDKTLLIDASNLTSKHDKDDAPITNQVNNNNGRASRRSVSVLLITEQEHNYLNAWRAWLSENTDRNAEEVLQMLRVTGGYHLPSRYPSSDDLTRSQHMEYIEAMVRQHG